MPQKAYIKTNTLHLSSFVYHFSAPIAAFLFLSRFELNAHGHFDWLFRNEIDFLAVSLREFDFRRLLYFPVRIKCNIRLCHKRSSPYWLN